MAILIMLPNLLWGPGDTDDVRYSFVWAEQFGKAMAAGNLYPRWLPDSFQGLGSPSFYFYPPASYWLAGGLKAIGLSTQLAITASFTILLALSGATMHAWLADRGTRPMLGALLYMAAPYHLMDIYVRGALAETAAFPLLPLVALGIARLPRRNGFILLCLSFAGLLITHLPMALLTGLFLVLPLLVWRLRTDRTVLLPAALAGALAFGLAAFYLVPALTLQRYASTQWLWGPYHQPSSWSALSPHSLIYQFPAFLAVAPVAMLIASRAQQPWRLITWVTGLASLGLIPFLWDLPLLGQVQFPWRLLAIVEFAAITAFMSARPQPWAARLAAILAVFAYGHWTQRTVDSFSRPVDFPALARDLPDAAEYLPTGFDGKLIRTTDRMMDLRQWQGLPRSDVVTVKRPGPVTVGRAAFPIWQVEREGVTIPSAGPILHFVAPTPGTYRIERVRLWQEKVGATISLIALLGLALLILRRRISHLSKFPSYSPSQALSDRPSFGRLRSRITGGDL
ncbi:integral membrane-like protein [Sphingobium terrigena]|uniref:Integral membrane-like protein n=2 Tax=Sphingobium terrigena TaxID=2304063 RepID=A0A418YRG7_9SPHN|nr:integral membrane-like protein [Sphingobium terrigena]